MTRNPLAPDQPLDPDEIVGHKTFCDDEGRRWHEPLTRSEGDAILAACDAAQAARADRYPTAEDAVRGLCDAFQRLKELGWKETAYAPADGELKCIVEVGSSGIHKGYCNPRPGRDGEKWWWIPEAGDTWPSKPVLYLPSEKERTAWEERIKRFEAEAAFAPVQGAGE